MNIFLIALCVLLLLIIFNLSVKLSALKTKRTKYPKRITYDCIQKWNQKLQFSKQKNERWLTNTWPGFVDNQGNKYLLYSIGSKGVKAYRHDPHLKEYTRYLYSIDIKDLVENFSDSFEFEDLIEDSQIIVDKSEYDRLKQIEQLHSKSINELNDVLKVKQ